MSKKRRRFTRDFKISVLREIESGKTHGEVARKYDLHPSLIGRWKKIFDTDPKNAFTGSRTQSMEDTRIAELEQLIGRIYAENVVLKKTLANLEQRLQSYRNRELRR